MSLRRLLAPASSRRGYAVVVVLAVIAMMVIYFAAGHTAILTQAAQSREQLSRLHHIELTGLALETARATPEGSLEFPAGDTPGEASPGKAAWRALDAQDPAWSALPGLRHRPGDRLLTIDWGIPGRVVQERYVFNPARSGAIRLSAPATSAAADSHSTAPVATVSATTATASSELAPDAAP